MKQISLCLPVNKKQLWHGCLWNSYELCFLLLSFLISLPLKSQDAVEETAPDKYRVVFTDKNENPYSIEYPEEFLSDRALERRFRQGIDIKYNDIPVTPSYIDSIKASGVSIHNISKWFNAVTFETSDEAALNKISNLSFVKQVLKSTAHIKRVKSTDDKLIKNETPVFNYGVSLMQTDIHHGSILHNNGFTGQGIQIAVIDNGFFMADELPAFSALWANGQILGTRDFTDENSNMFEGDSHGMKVFSIIGGSMPGMLVGTATGAEFWLLRSEISDTEYIIEEDNWISAAEFADSAGVDIINTSLGYTTFDNPLQDHTYFNMDGNSTRISIAADIAASKGMLVIISAGNQGDTEWEYISAPADADSVLAIGAIDASGQIASFSSRGPTFDGRIKPDVVAIGKGTYYAGLDGGLWKGNGTSLSAPIITGLAACLWQANPGVTAMDIFEAIRKSAHLYTSPDTIYGYGIPDFNLADVLLKSESGALDISEKTVVFPNPFHDEVYIFFEAPLHSPVQIDFIDRSGMLVLSQLYTGYDNQKYFKVSKDLFTLSRGIYIIRITTADFTNYCKLIKN